MKNLFIAEKPSVAREFAKALGFKGAENAGSKDGFIEMPDAVVTWCYGHLVSMSYPEVYDPELKRWNMNTIPFIPEEYKYEVLDGVKNQFNVVKRLLNRDDVECIYVCTDSGREGEYIYRLVDQQAEVPSTKQKKRVWIDSQTEEEILRGIKEAKELSAYDNLSDAAYLRAKEDYLMGINFSRALTLKYGYTVRNYLGADKCVIAVGRVMTCVLGMIVGREREIRNFVPTPFYRIVASMDGFDAEWKAVADTLYENSPLLYKENGFKKREDAEVLVGLLSKDEPLTLKVEKIEKKIEKKAPPLLYNLAELQNDCSKFFKINPSQTLAIVQELYEKKLVTYPRTDARVLSTAVSKEIAKNIGGLRNYAPVAPFATNIMNQGGYKGIAKSKYVNDKQITDHYAIIPTGQGLNNLKSVSDTARGVYDIIAKRFISIFYPAAEYEKIGLVLSRHIDNGGKKDEQFSANFKRLVKEGYLAITKRNTDSGNDKEKAEESKLTPEMMEKLNNLKKGDLLDVSSFDIKEGETSAPKRYSSGTLILAMENAGNLIEDEELREQIKSCGIGTSATRDAIISKLEKNKYIQLNNKTQIVTPTFLGEIIYDVVKYSINNLLRAEMTASWEKGLSGVAEGSISKDEYTTKMNTYVVNNTELVKKLNNERGLIGVFNITKPFYEKKPKATKKVKEEA